MAQGGGYDFMLDAEGQDVSELKMLNDLWDLSYPTTSHFRIGFAYCQ